ncbi:LOW QUALITY PROTEIN: claudin-10-like [Anableps anableps]
MWRRTIQILGLLLCILGWAFVGCTLAMDHWRVAQLGGRGGSSVVVTAWYWSDLWKDCYEDSTAVVNCVDFGVLWTVKSYIQGVRGLLLTGLCLGLAGTVLSFFGMELMAACAFQLLGCTSDVAGYCLYINKVTSAFLHSKADPSKLSYEVGPPLYLGLVGSLLLSLGCTLHCATACRAIHPERPAPFPSIRQDEERNVFPEKMHMHRLRIPSYKLAEVVTV